MQYFVGEPRTSLKKQGETVGDFYSLKGPMFRPFDYYWLLGSLLRGDKANHVGTVREQFNEKENVSYKATKLGFAIQKFKALIVGKYSIRYVGKMRVQGKTR